jgi:NAD(P)-dependent dehydrogenase (short-subunit alcohol dehydrogenase family)
MEEQLLTGKTALITGGTGGIGRPTALALARLGATTVLVGRDPVRGEAARRFVAEASGSSRVHLLQADLSSLESIHLLAARFSEQHRHLDLLINAAGTIERRRRLSADGIELTLAVNLVAPFVLTALLLEPLRESAPARVINLSSREHRRGSIDPDDLEFRTRRYSASAAYSQSKLGVILFSAELSRRLSGAGVTVNAIHPGLTDTNFGRRGGILSLGWTLKKPWAITPDQAAGNLLYLATSPEVAGITGAYFEQQRRVRPKPLAEDLVLATRLWDQLERLTHGASEIVNPRGSVGGVSWQSN